MEFNICLHIKPPLICSPFLYYSQTNQVPVHGKSMFYICKIAFQNPWYSNSYGNTDPRWFILWPLEMYFIWFWSLLTTHNTTNDMFPSFFSKRNQVPVHGKLMFSICTVGILNPWIFNNSANIWPQVVYSLAFIDMAYVY